MRKQAERRRRRILVLPAWYPWPDRPGYGSFCRDQAVAVSRIHDVVVVAWTSDRKLTAPFAVSEASEEGVRTFRIRVRPRSRPKLETVETVLGVLSVLNRLRLQGWTADVVHAHEYAAGIPATLAASALRAPLVVSERSTALALGHVAAHDLAQARRVFRRAAVVCPDSHDLGRRIRPLAGDTPIRPVPNPVDTNLFVPTRRQRRDDVRLLVVGNLIPRKEHRRLIDALKLVVDTDPSVSLDVVGNGESRPALEDHARQRGVRSRVRFHGHLDKAGVARMMQAADVLVLPSLWENLPCVLLEAMATGLPVVATRVGGTDEIVDRSVGELVEPGSEDALAAAILRVANDREAYDPAAMHETAAGRYGYAAVARDLSETYELALVLQANRAGPTGREAPESVPVRPSSTKVG